MISKNKGDESQRIEVDFILFKQMNYNHLHTF